MKTAESTSTCYSLTLFSFLSFKYKKQQITRGIWRQHVTKHHRSDTQWVDLSLCPGIWVGLWRVWMSSGSTALLNPCHVTSEKVIWFWMEEKKDKKEIRRQKLSLNTWITRNCREFFVFFTSHYVYILCLTLWDHKCILIKKTVNGSGLPHPHTVMSTEERPKRITCKGIFTSSLW